MFIDRHQLLEKFSEAGYQKYLESSEGSHHYSKEEYLAIIDYSFGYLQETLTDVGMEPFRIIGFGRWRAMDYQSLKAFKLLRSYIKKVYFHQDGDIYYKRYVYSFYKLLEAYYVNRKSLLKRPHVCKGLALMMHTNRHNVGRYLDKSGRANAMYSVMLRYCDIYMRNLLTEKD
jgi:hypothetical protein